MQTIHRRIEIPKQACAINYKTNPKNHPRALASRRAPRIVQLAAVFDDAFDVGGGIFVPRK
jgi:hypothetical protein